MFSGPCPVRMRLRSSSKLQSRMWCVASIVQCPRLRVDRRKDLWELTVEPAGTGAVSILAPLGRACTEPGALCTADGQALTTGLGHSVRGPVAHGQGVSPLAASFVSVPGEHDGETAFWLELSFDAAVAQGSRRHIRALLGASGGAVTKLRRKDDRLDHWQLQVTPTSHDAVTVSLSPACRQAGAVCTEDGRTYTTALATRVQGPPGLTVADAEVARARRGVDRTLAMTGCRVSEALGIRACDVDLEAAELRIATLKRRKEHWRAVPVPEEWYRPSTSSTAYGLHKGPHGRVRDPCGP